MSWPGRMLVPLSCLPLVLAGCLNGDVSALRVSTDPLGLQEVVAIAGAEGLGREVDTEQPVSETYAPDGPCRAVRDHRAAFGDTWTLFRSVTDRADLSGAGGSPGTAAEAAVTQNVVAFPGVEEARAVFDRRMAAVQECAALDPGSELARPDTDVAVLTDDGHVVAFVVKKSVLVDVSVVGLPDNARIADEISRAIVEPFG